MKVLIVVDMQNDFIDGALGTPEAVEIVPRVVEKIKGWTGRVYATQDTHQTDYLETQEGKNLPVTHCVEGTQGWEIAPTVQAALSGVDHPAGSVRLTKPSFGSRKLAETLLDLHREEAIEEIELIGLCTDICVISNALILKVFLPEVPIFVDAACCAGVTPQSHRNALEAMKMCQIHIRNA